MTRFVSKFDFTKKAQEIEIHRTGQLLYEPLFCRLSRACCCVLADAESISRDLNEVDSELVTLAKGVLANEDAKPADKVRLRDIPCGYVPAGVRTVTHKLGIRLHT